MSDNNYIKLKNGEKFYFKNKNKKIKLKDFSNLARNWGIFFDDNCSKNLTSGEIGLIFNKVKEYALMDGKTKFSKEEMQAFIEDNCDEESIKELGLNQKSLVQFLTELQKKSDNSLANPKQNINSEIYDEILEIFPIMEDYKDQDGMHFLETDDGFKLVINDGQIVNYSGEDFKYKFKNGVIVSCQQGKIGDADFYKNLYTNGELWRSLDSNGNTIYNSRVVDLLNLIIYEPNVDKLVMIIEQSCQNGQIGQDMDDYFKVFGHELFDDIAMSEIPDDVKEGLIDKIYGIFSDTRLYKPELYIEHSQVKNDYYTGDEYSVRYNGPIVNIYNETTGEETRLNLQKILQLENFSKGEKLSFLKKIQKLPAEVLENLAIEVAYIKAIDKEDTYTVFGSDFMAGASYHQETMNIFLPEGEFLIHELGHALDHIFYGDSFDFDTFASMDSEFKAKYDELITQYEAKGNKRFDINNPHEFKVSKKTGDNYITLDEREGFAICFQAMMGCDDLQTKFLFKEMPELMDYAIEHYRNIRSMKKEYRFRNLPEMRNENNY